MTFLCWVLRRWVFEAYYREYPTRNLELGIPAAGYSVPEPRIHTHHGEPYLGNDQIP